MSIVKTKTRKPQLPLVRSLVDTADLFDTRLVPGYIADFDSRYGITNDGTGKASSWAERWGNGMSWDQATPAKRPAITQNILGNAPGLAGNVANQVFMAGNTAVKSMLDGLTAYTIYAIYQNNSTGAGYAFAYGNMSAFGSSTRNKLLFVRGATGDTSKSVIGPYDDVPGLQCHTETMNFTNTTGRLYRSGVLVGQNVSMTGLTSPTVGPASSAAILSYTGGGSSWLPGYLVRMVICSGEHTEAQQQATWAGILSEYSERRTCAVGHPSRVIQMLGDSITQSNSLPAGSKSLSDFVWNVLGAKSNEVVVNLGHSGGIASNINTDRASYADIVPLSFADKMILVIWVGINDVAAGTSGATIYNTIKTGFQAAKTARPGLKVIVCTPIAWNGAGTSPAKQTELVALRTAINTNAVADGVDAVCDFGGLTQFDVTDQTKANNTSYYNADKLHPVDGGNLLLATALATTINSV